MATEWFHIGLGAFKKHVFNKKFHITDDCTRYEWQGRRSTHNHRVYWMHAVAYLFRLRSVSAPPPPPLISGPLLLFLLVYIASMADASRSAGAMPM
jgi:hypothetical protein